MKNIKFIYLLILLCCTICKIDAQPPHTFTQYKTSDGLYQKTIMHILQDTKGFIWFATWDGIYKFDGYHFKNYKNRKGNNNGFNNSRIDYLAEGEQSYLWMISYDLQVYRFDMENEIFLSLPYSNYQAESIHPSHYGHTWIITNKGDLIEAYNSTDRKTLRAYNFFDKNHLSKSKVYNLLEDDKNNLWILSQAGIYKLIFNKNHLYTIHYYKLPNSVYDATETLIGYSTQEVKVSNRSVVDIVLKDDMQALEEVVVVGYGTMKKSDLTGSVSSITSDNFKLGTDLTPQQLMQGAFSGVNISQNSGKPGGSNTIRVRGGTSITASNDPLYVIDGVPISTSAGVNQSNIGSSTTDFFDQEPINPLSNINPNDIESINILKDASATAIYGSRGANGVIMITTKKGKAGMRQLDYSFNLGVSTVAKKLDVLTGDEYRKTVSELGLTLDDKGQNTDWQDVIFRTAISQNHYVSFMSGSENTSYRASAGYSNQNGVMEGSGMKSANARMNINHKALNDKLKLNMNISYGETNSDQAPVSNTVGSEMGSSMLYEAYVFNPTYPIYNEEGDYYDVPPYRVNPASFSKELLDERATSQFLGNLTADWNFYKPFTLQVNAGYNKNTINRNSYISKSNLLGNGNNGYVTVQKLSDYSKLLETILKYNQSFGKHNIDAMVGYSWQYFYSEGQTTKAYGFLSDNFKWYSLAAAQTVESVSSYAESNTLISMYGRINYNYADKYLLTATVRRDGSSRFGSGNKWGIFPSVAASWRISQEDFFQNDIMSDLKLRASFGITGSQEIGNYNSLSTLGASTNGYLVGGEKITIVLPQQYTNPDLKWEQTAQTDIYIENTKTELPDGISKLYLPSISVMVPVVEAFLIVTLTPIKGSFFESVTIPETVLFCAMIFCTQSIIRIKLTILKCLINLFFIDLRFKIHMGKFML